jgi:tRNA (cmo5U34)-methyltransferase
MNYNHNLNIDKALFYAISDAEEYDATIRLTVPYYDIIHKTLIDIFRYHFQQNSQTKSLFLDIGAGTGTEAIAVLKEFPQFSAVAVDLAAPMKLAFDENYNKIIGRLAEKRYTYIVEDIFKLDFNRQISNTPSEYTNYKKLAAISAYCIHHFTIEGKEIIYRKMFDFLDKGGMLVNIDLFNYQSKIISEYAHDFDIQYINDQFENPSPEYISSQKIPITLRKALKDNWIEHMNQDNILNSVEEQIELLKKIGFTQVECVFKYLQQGIIVAIK